MSKGKDASAKIRVYYELNHWWIEFMGYHGLMVVSTHLRCRNLSQNQVIQIVEQLKESSLIRKFLCPMSEALGQIRAPSQNLLH